MGRRHGIERTYLKTSAICSVLLLHALTASASDSQDAAGNSMELHAAYTVNGEPVFGTNFKTKTLDDLRIAHEAGIHVVTGGKKLLDVESEMGRYCLEHGIKVIGYLTRHTIGRPWLRQNIGAVETEIPIITRRLPRGPAVVQIDDELIRYEDATSSALLGCERGVGGTQASKHEAPAFLFWPQEAAAEVAAVKDSPNLWGYWVLGDSRGYLRSSLRALYRIVKELDDHDHPVCAGFPGTQHLRNFGPQMCDVMILYYYPFAREGYRREHTTRSTQWITTGAREQVPGIPFIGINQGFWEAEGSERHINIGEPLTPGSYGSRWRISFGKELAACSRSP